jgi:hypothetical protein
MASTWRDRLADIQLEIQQQNAEWTSIKNQLVALGECNVIIPLETLEEIDAVKEAAYPVAPPHKYYVRG